MTRDDIIQWAKEAGFQESWLNLWCDNFESFAALVAADARTAERVACAAQCQDIYSWRGAYASGSMHTPTLEACAAAIRAREDSA